MKKLLTPLLVLAVILALSAGNSTAMAHLSARWQDQLRRADALAQQERWTEAAAAMEEGYGDWSRHQTDLHIVTEHDAVEGAESMYLRAAAFARTQELSEFRAETAGLCAQLRLLTEMERLHIGNIL